MYTHRYIYIYTDISLREELFTSNILSLYSSLFLVNLKLNYQ